jgi:hypothetical protein
MWFSATKAHDVYTLTQFSVGPCPDGRRLIREIRYRPLRQLQLLLHLSLQGLVYLVSWTCGSTCASAEVECPAGSERLDGGEQM